MAKKKKGSSEEAPPIIIKKVIKKAGGHHGGAWKVAYADFVTAMMAFFLLMWLLNVASPEQIIAVAGYFDPSHPKVSSSTSGAGGVMGGLSVSSSGAMASNASPFVTPTPNRQKFDKQKESDVESEEKLEGEGEEGSDLHGKEEEEQEKFEEAVKEIKQAIEEVPELKPLLANLMIDITPEGLRIQIVDQKGESMFPSGSAKMYEKTEKLVAKITDIIKELPNDISIRGHTDSMPFGTGADYTNWELSTDRANSSRRVIMASGMPEKRINNVIGKSDKEHLLPGQPNDPKNRRISIVLLRDKIVNPPEPKKQSTGITKRKVGKPKAVEPAPAYRKSDGEVYFP